MGASNNPSAELVQLGQAETLRALDDYDCCIRHIHADFHDGRGAQNIYFSQSKIRHYFFFFLLAHFAVQHTYFIFSKNSLF